MKKKRIVYLFGAIILSANLSGQTVTAAESAGSVPSSFTYSVAEQEIRLTEGALTQGIIIDNETLPEIQAALNMHKYIVDHWDNLPMEKDMDLYESQGKAVGKPGDILIAVADVDNKDLNAIMVGSLTSHSAMVDADPSKVLEVMPGGVQHLENDWRTRYKKMLILRPKTDKETIMGAINRGYALLGTPLAFDFTNKTKMDAMYCSQFVWRCYKDQGFDLDSNGGDAVFPYDFIGDKVSIVYKQG